MELSQPSDLYAGKVIGFSFGVPDFDEESGIYEAMLFYPKSPGPYPWFTANDFGDAILIGLKSSAVQENSWGRIKASFR